MGRLAERKFWDKATETPLAQLRNEWICDKNVTDKQCLDAILPHLKKGKTLDLGCGIGRLTKLIKKTFPSETIIGIDISPAMLKIAEADWLKAQASKSYKVLDFPFYYQNDGRTIPGPGSHFDNVFSMAMFQHIPDEAVLTYLSEVYRVLKTGGIFRFQFVNQGEEAPMSFVRSDKTMTRWLHAAGLEPKTVESLIYPEWTWITAQKS